MQCCIQPQTEKASIEMRENVNKWSRSGNSNVAWEAALVKLACHVHASQAELADAMLCMLWDMFNGWGLAGENQVSKDTSMDTTGLFCFLSEKFLHCLL